MGRRRLLVLIGPLGAALALAGCGGSGRHPQGARRARGRAPRERATADLARRRARLQGRLHDAERSQSRHREARHPRRRPLLPLARGQGSGRRSRHAARRRQRGCVPADDRELPVEVRSLWREPERVRELSFGALECHDVFKIYRSGPVETVALRGLELRIEPRELVAVFGPSGSGKSTMLHLAAGLDEPSAGELRVFGRSLSRLDEAGLAAYRAREVAIVFQSGNLWSTLSARENVALALRLAGRRRVEAAVDRALDAFDLRRRERRPAGTPSGGAQHRIPIAA